MRKLLILLAVTSVLAEDCLLNVSLSKSPLVLNDDFQIPDRNGDNLLLFSQDELFYVMCPKTTTSPYLAEKGDHLACKGNNDVLNIRTVEIIDFSKIRCQPVTITTLKKLEETCENDFALMQVGFEIYDNFVPVITVCYDEPTFAPFYIHYELEKIYSTIGSDPDGCTTENSCDFVDSGGLYTNIDMNEIYFHGNDIFKELGVSNLIEDSLVPFSLVAQVLPNYVLYSDRLQTYPFFDYVNIVPVWTTVYYFMIKHFPLLYENIIHLPYRGTLGVANAPNSSVELYLYEQQIPVPRWLWFAYNAPNQAKELILFYNNVNVDATEELSDICKAAHLVYFSEKVFFGRCYFSYVINKDLKTFINNTFL